MIRVTDLNGNVREYDEWMLSCAIREAWSAVVNARTAAGEIRANMIHDILCACLNGSIKRTDSEDQAAKPKSDPLGADYIVFWERLANSGQERIKARSAAEAIKALGYSLNHVKVSAYKLDPSGEAATAGKRA